MVSIPHRSHQRHRGVGRGEAGGMDGESIRLILWRAHKGGKNMWKIHPPPPGPPDHTPLLKANGGGVLSIQSEDLRVN